ncbi:MAG: tRNA-dihydrouridine synthase family protein [Patescibacteria group bacterium]
MPHFWEKLPKPFFALAPMADVTDAAFRRMIAKYGKPDVTWTEFVSADGLASHGREVLKRDLVYTEEERPIVAQLFSSHPEKMREAARLCAELGFDGIDINMGCPDRSIEKQGAGAAMIKTPDIARAVIEAAKEGIADAGKNIPVSVKTRVGYNQVQLKEWIPFLLSCDIAALTVHARTRKEMSKVPARWEHIKEVVAIRDRMGVSTKIIGNGDVRDVSHGKALAHETGCDGIMIGRAIFGNPWLFATVACAKHPSNSERPVSFFSRLSNLFFNKVHGSSTFATQSRDSADRRECVAENAQIKNDTGTASEDTHKYWLHATSVVPIRERLRVMVEHTKLFMELLGDIKSFAIMKKHYKAYVNGFDGAKELRVKLMEAKDAREVEDITREFLD